MDTLQSETGTALVPLDTDAETEEKVIDTGEEATSEELLKLPSEAETEKADGGRVKMRERLHLVCMLLSVILATVGVIVWGGIVTDKISSIEGTFSKKIVENFAGSTVSAAKGEVSRPSLHKIPSSPVEEGSDIGASEDETVAESESHEGGVTLPVKKVDLTPETAFSLINETPYEPDVISLYAADMKTHTVSEIRALYGEDAPQVLIIHTHGTESYLDEGADSYVSDDPFRTYDTEKNVVAVGRAVAERLREHGIVVIHIETMFDGENYNEAYVNSASEVRRILEKYPSVEYVFDIHRDAMFTRDGTNLAPTSPVSADGGDVAQIMLVVGTSHAGADHGEWEDNLSFALKLQKNALKENSTLMRGINLRSASFNAQCAKGALLVEIGAAGNSLSEAIRAGEIFADAIAETVK